jgi:hypothetical protein
MKFGNMFEYETLDVVSDNHIVYYGVRISIYLDWERDDVVEAVFNPADGSLFFQEWIDEANIWNKSPTLKFS